MTAEEEAKLEAAFSEGGGQKAAAAPADDASKSDNQQQDGNQAADQQAAADAAKPEVFNFDAEFKKKYGIESTDFDAIKQKATLAEQLQNADPFDNDELRAINTVMKERGVTAKEAIQYLSIDPTKLDAREQYHTFRSLTAKGMSAEAINRQILKEFPDLDSDDADLKQQALEDLQYKVATEGIGDKLKELRDKAYQKPGATRAEVLSNEAKESQAKAWDTELTKIAADTKKYKLAFDGSNETLDYDLGVDITEIKDRVISKGYPATPENLEAARVELESKALRAQLPKILAKIKKDSYKDGQNQVESTLYNELHNPSQSKTVTTTGKTVNKEAELAKLDSLNF